MSILIGDQWHYVLHTASAYAITNIDTSIFNSAPEDSLQSEISAVQQKEETLYNKFGESTYRGFHNKLLSLFQNGRHVSDALSQYSADNLATRLKEFQSVNAELWEQEVRIEFDFSKLQNLNYKVKDVLDFQGELSKWGTVTGKGFVFQGKFNTSTIKNVLNEVLLRRGRRFDPGAGYQKAVDTLVEKLLENGGISIQIATEDENGKNSYTDYVKSRIPNFPWGVLKSQILEAEARGEASELYHELERAILKIKDFVTRILPEESPEVAEAALAVWNRHIAMEEYKGNKILSLFQGTTTSNFGSAVQGALGEFGAAVIFEYLSQHIPEQSYATLLGNMIIDSQKPKTDVRLFQDIGLQVKNFQIHKDYMRDIGTTTSPTRFAALAQLNDYDTMNFYDFLTNYYFNLSYQGSSEGQQGMQSLSEYLGKHLGAVMNMAILDGAQDVVTFYLIDNRYLVPCSDILLAAEMLNLKPQVHSAYAGLTDLAYAAAARADGKDGDKSGELVYTHHSAIGYEYWNYLDTSWHPTEKNERKYMQILNNISLRTEFNLITLIKHYDILAF